MSASASETAPPMVAVCFASSAYRRCILARRLMIDRLAMLAVRLAEVPNRDFDGHASALDRFDKELAVAFAREKDNAFEGFRQGQKIDQNFICPTCAVQESPSASA
jgi:hypothetical protein